MPEQADHLARTDLRPWDPHPQEVDIVLHHTAATAHQEVIEDVGEGEVEGVDMEAEAGTTILALCLGPDHDHPGGAAQGHIHLGLLAGHRLHGDEAAMRTGDAIHQIVAEVEEEGEVPVTARMTAVVEAQALEIGWRESDDSWSGRPSDLIAMAAALLITRWLSHGALNANTASRTAPRREHSSYESRSRIERNIMWLGNYHRAPNVYRPGSSLRSGGGPRHRSREARRR